MRSEGLITVVCQRAVVAVPRQTIWEMPKGRLSIDVSVADDSCILWYYCCGFVLLDRLEACFQYVQMRFLKIHSFFKVAFRLHPM